VKPGLREGVEAGDPQAGGSPWRGGGARGGEALRQRRVQADEAIRTIQQREIAKQMPEYLKKQLMTDRKARAERSLDPNAVQAEEDTIPATVYDNEAPATALTPEQMEEIRILAIDDKAAQGYLKQWEQLQKLPEYIQRYARCKAGL
jgi:hypothetical protein